MTISHAEHSAIFAQDLLTLQGHGDLVVLHFSALLAVVSVSDIFVGMFALTAPVWLRPSVRNNLRPEVIDVKEGVTEEAAMGG